MRGRAMIRMSLLAVMASCFAWMCVAEEPIAAAKQIVIIGIPTQISTDNSEKNLWFQGLSEQLLYFRIPATDAVELIPLEKVHTFVRTRVDAAAAKKESVYFKLAAATGATCLIMPSFDIDRDGKSIQVYVELIARSDKENPRTYERTFSADSCVAGIDSCALWLYRNMGVPISPELTRFYAFPPFFLSVKELKLLGECAARAEGDSSNFALAEKYLKILDKDPRAIMAQYNAAHYYSLAGEYVKAGGLLQDLLQIVAEYKPLYVDVCRNLRLSGRSADAIAYAAAAEGKGYTSTALLVEGGLALEALGRNNRARRAFETILASDTAEPHALLFFARENNRAGKTAEAIGLTERILSRDPANGMAWMEKGKALLQQKKYNEAIAAFEKGIETNADDPAIFQLSGDASMTIGSFGKAAGFYEELIRRQPAGYQNYLKTAEAWERDGNAARAMKTLTRAESFFVDSTDLQRRIGLVAFQLGDTAKTVLYLEKYANKFNENPEVFMMLGDIYTRMGLFDKAFYAYNHAMPLMKNKNECRYALAAFYLQKGDADAAIPFLKEIIRDNPDFHGAYRKLGDAWLTVGKHNEALICYLKARKAGENDRVIAQRIAFCFYTTGNYLAAESEYTAVLDSVKNDPDIYFYLAIMALMRKDGMQADVRLKKAYQLGEPSPLCAFQLGQGYDAIGRNDEALKAYMKCWVADTANIEALKAIATDYGKLDKPAESAKYCLRIFHLNSERYQEYLAQAGVLFEKAGDPLKARELYGTFLDAGYVNPEINCRLARIEYMRADYSKTASLLLKIDKQVLLDRKMETIAADAFFQIGDFVTAIPWLETLWAARSRDAAIGEKLALAYEKSGAIGPSRSIYRTLFVGAPPAKKADYACALAGLFEREDNTAEAIRQYTQNSAAYPTDIRNYERLVSIHLKRNNVSEARAVLEKVTVLSAGNPRFEKILATVCRRQNDRMGAIKHFKLYLNAVPDDGEAWVGMGAVYLDKRQFEPAAEALGKAVEFDPNNFNLQTMLGSAFAGANRFREAAVAYEKAHALTPADPVTLTSLAGCYRGLRDTTQVIAALRTLTTLTPDVFEIKAELGTLLLARGKREEGISILETALLIKPADSKTHLLLARAYENQGNTTARYAHLKKVESADPNNAELHYEFGRYHNAVSLGEKAEKEFLQSISLDGSFAPARYEYARILFRQGKIAESFGQIEQAFRLDSYNADICVLYAACARAMNYPDIARQKVDAALFLDSNNVAALNLAGVLFKEKGEPKNALQVLQRAIAIDKNCGDCYVTLGRLCYDENNYTAAAGYFKRALEIGGYDEHLTLLMAKSLLLVGQAAKAAEIFAQVLVTNPKQPEAYYRLVHFHIVNGDFDDARALQAGNAQDEKSVWHHLVNGEMQEVDGAWDAAMISYQVALRLVPQMPEALAGCGRVDLFNKRFSAAVENFGKAVAFDPFNPYLQLDMAKGYEGIGEYQSAMAIYEDISEKYPSVSEAFCRIAEIKSSKQDHATAIDIIKQGLQHNPENPWLYMALAHEYTLINNYSEAVTTYEDALKKGGKRCIEAYLRVGTIYVEYLKDPKEARKYLKKYIKAGGKDTTAQAQLDVLEKI
jgi:tetratricopeptide (TPR) repeat protein